MMMKKLLIILIFLVQITNVFAQEKHVEGYLTEAERKADTPFKERYNTRVRGNMTFAANNILNRPPADTPYNGSDGNHSFNLQYIDIDDFVDENGDGIDDTFSSSKSSLNLPSCSRVVYAGLYWAGIYPYDNWNEEGGVNTRDDDFNTMKFKVPGGNYVDLVADKVDAVKRELIYDDGVPTEKPYVCYKDVTTMVQGLVDGAGDPIPNGDYYGANIKATLGKDNIGGRLGSSAGWVMVVIYENETQKNKKFYIFDGFSTIKKATNPYTDVPVSGFQTVPSGPVRANLMVAALEGDKSITGDALQIERRNSGNFETLTTGNLNKTDNFFNGSITHNNTYLPGRDPNSKNTLGFDVDMFSLSNPSKSILNNGQTDTTLRFTTDGDSYWPFLLGMSVEVIEPKVQLIKTIEDASGNDISGQTVGLGNELFYNVRFQNVGTDNAKNTRIIDILPKNVDFLPADLILPPELEHTRTQILNDYEPPTAANSFRGKLIFNIPDDLVEENDGFFNIKIKVAVVSDCSQLRDVCSNRISNQAFANYESDRGGAPPINNEESYAGIDDCNFGVVGTSNFLVDTSGCKFERSEVMCTASLDISAGNGFLSYAWENANNLGVIIGTSQTLTVTQSGTYIVNKVAPAGCISNEETIHVVGFNNEPNPLASFADQVLTSCASNNFELAEFYLCGINDETRINLPFTGATTVQWFKLDETSCNNAVAGCANVDTGCTWVNQGPDDLDKTFDTDGQYRLDVLYDGRCPQSYYFNIYKATLNPTIVKEDLLCGNDAVIRIDNIPAGYEYMLSGPGIATPAFQTGNSFTVSDPGDYDLAIRLIGSPSTACTYIQEDINIQSPLIQLNVTQGDLNCADDDIQITASISGVPGEYSYEITRNGVPEASSGGFIANDSQTYSFSQGGTFVISVESVDGCIATETLVINKPLPITLSATTTKNISCVGGTSDGIITLTPGGGTLSLGSTHTIRLISAPASVTTPIVVTGTTYDVALGDEGVYIFEVIDSNNCSTTASATVVVEPELVFDVDSSDISCNGLTDGQIEVGPDATNVTGYSYLYSIDNWSTSNGTGVFSGLSANNYTVKIRASKDDLNGNSYQCEYEVTATINEPLGLTGGSAAETDLSCDVNGNTVNGSITFTAPTGGTGAYTYYYGLDGSGTFTPTTVTMVSVSVAGDYNVKVADANGCELIYPDVSIAPLPAEPDLSEMVTYNCDGTGNITITPLDASYTYTLGATTNSTGVFSSIGAGNYTVSVNYGSSCTKDIDVTVAGDRALSGSSVATPVTCNGENDGTIVITVNNLGSTVANNYEYSIDGGTNWLPLGGTSTTPLTVSGLIAGTYNVEVRETGNTSCEVSAGTVTVNEPTVVTVVSVAETKGITCRLPAGATLEPTANGGNGAAYTYELFNNAGATGAALQTTAPFTDVAAGNYWVVATDVTGVCASVPYAVTVTAPTTLSVVASSVVCYDGSNGEVTVNITGGELPFAVSLNGAAPVSINTTSYTFTGQSAQNHVITVTDNNGCTATDDTDILAPLSGTVTPTDANCAVNSGQIVVSGSGGTGAGTYEYAIVADTVVPVAGDYAAGNSPAKVA
ncbi:exported protein of unknown function [Tenacibaculum insulae]